MGSVTSPSLPERLLTCTIALLAEVQLASAVQSSLVPSLKLQVALSWHGSTTGNRRIGGHNRDRGQDRGNHGNER
jgi:hypothetical protein